MKRVTLFFLLLLSMNIIIGCGSDDDTTSQNQQDNGSSELSMIQFSEVSAPDTEAAQKEVRISENATLKFADGTELSYPLSYKTLFRTGDEVGGDIAGMILDKNGDPLKTSYSDDTSSISNYPDANSVLTKDGKHFLITHYEQSPGAVDITELSYNDTEKSFSAKELKNIDFSSVGGTWINCAGDKTPWGTHLGGEEDYYLDAYQFDNQTKNYMTKHISYCNTDNGSLTGGYTPPLFDNTANFSWWCGIVKDIKEEYLGGTDFTPYNYGYIVEIDTDASMNTTVKKLYAMGRSTPEMATVMPDNKTVYIADDGGYRGIFMFVADEAGNLGSGNIYMAKWNQTSAANGGSADITWVNLGHTEESAVENIIEKKPEFSDIFLVGNPDSCDTGNGYKIVKAGDPADAGEGAYKTQMCLKLRTGEDRSGVFTSDEEVKMAARALETRKYGAYLGATAEFKKAEGLTFNPDKNELYVAISKISSSMSDGEGDIQLEQEKAGAVYKLQVGTANDAAGNPINSSYVGTSMSPLVIGEYVGTPDSLGNTANVDKISSPDNIRYIGHDILLIGEDTGYHINNATWTYNTNTGELTRIMTAPIEAEFTGMFATLEKNNSLYVFTNVQHPREDISDYSAQARRGYVGYFRIPLQ
ncbi:alkaline phosphatase PhoX [Flexistipes sinusarabici]|uniref:alkaline phosphatase PhoX n=1 Tax=Flexistipes sinusarabici TaxID=2352 RepID=UPI0023567808|nr:alkaline phosphatase PhoX [Flexistipes sinusarabici]